MSEKAFVVTMVASDGDEWALTANDVYSRLTDALGYSGEVWVGTVVDYVPAKPGRVFVGKIPAIKEVRGMTQMGLVEAKDIVDATKLLGKMRFASGITIEYGGSHDGNDHFTITDNR